MADSRAETERLRALNRAKQARFRERQKERKAELEQQYEATVADLERERELNERMRLTVDVLDKVREHKEASVAVLQAAAAAEAAALRRRAQVQELPTHAAVQQLPVAQSAAPALRAASLAQQASQDSCRVSTPHAGPAGPSAAATLHAAAASDAEPHRASRNATCSSEAFDGAASSGSGAGGSTTTISPRGPTPAPQYQPSAALRRTQRGLTFTDRVSMFTSLLSATQPSQQILQQHVADGLDAFSMDQTSRHALATHITSNRPLLVSHIISMEPADVLEVWGEFGDFAAELAEGVDSGRLSEEEANKRMGPAALCQVVRGMLQLRYKPDLLACLLEHTKLPGESEEAAAARWRQLAADMALPRDTASRFVAPYAAYRERMRQLGSQAASALATAQEVQQALDRQMGGLHGTSLSAMAERYLSLFDAASALTQQPSAALVALVDFLSATAAVFSPMQKTRLFAACKPLHPDVTIMVQHILSMHDLLS